LVEIRHASRFSDAARQAEKYRVGRVSASLLATYEAERHPVGAQLLATDEKYLAPVSPYQDRIRSTVVEALPWDDVDAVLVRPDGYVCWTVPGEDVDRPLRAWFGTA
jgi:hypothetical protein